MKIVESKIILKYLSVSGMFSYSEDKIININKELREVIEHGKPEVTTLLSYVFFNDANKEALKVNPKKTIPNVQVSISVNGKELHIIRMPQYKKIDTDGKSVLVKSLLSYTYDGEEVKSISDSKFSLFIEKTLGVTK